jgi:hypothetical protein
MATSFRATTFSTRRSVVCSAVLEECLGPRLDCREARSACDASPRRRWGSLDDAAALRRRRPRDESDVSHRIDNRTLLTPWDLVLQAGTAPQMRNFDCVATSRSARSSGWAVVRASSSMGVTTPPSRRERVSTRNQSGLTASARESSGPSRSPRTGPRAPQGWRARRDRRRARSVGRCAARVTPPAPQSKPVAPASRLVAQTAPLVASELGLRFRPQDRHRGPQYSYCGPCPAI